MMTFKIVERIKVKQPVKDRYKTEYAAVFMIQCKKNRKVFLSSSVTARQKIHNHWQDLIKGQHRNVALQSDFTKYGISNFKIRILARLSNRELPKMKVNEINSFLDEVQDNYFRQYSKVLYNKRVKSFRTVANVDVNLSDIKSRKKPKKNERKLPNKR
jgi:hypothetical protein